MPYFTKEIRYNKDEWKVDEERILDFIEEEQMVGANDLQKEFGIAYQTAEKYLQALVSEDKLNKFELGGGDRKYKRYTVNHEQSEEEKKEPEQEVEKEEQPDLPNELKVGDSDEILLR